MRYTLKDFVHDQCAAFVW